MKYKKNYDAPLFEALKTHAALERASFHTPGHKGSGFLSLDQTLDLTEPPGTALLV